MRKFMKIAVGVCVAAVLSTGASAATLTAPIAVTASVAASCSFGASALAFGAYTGSITDVNASVTANCILGTTYTIALNPGVAPGATTTTRKLVSGANTIAYSLYSDSGHTVNWGNITGTDTVAGSGSGGAQAYPVYGRIVAGLTPAAGSYTDTVTATITF